MPESAPFRLAGEHNVSGAKMAYGMMKVWVIDQGADFQGLLTAQGYHGMAGRGGRVCKIK